MIKVNDGKIRKRELAGILIFLFAIQAMDTTPDLLFKLGKNAAWMIPILSSFVTLIPFFVLLGIVKKRNMGLTELIFTLMGKRMGTFVILLFFIIIFSSTVINSRSYTDVFNTMFYPKTPIPYLYVMLIGACFYIAKRGLENIARTAWIFTPIVLILMFSLVGFVYDDIALVRIYPIAGPGLTTILKESVVYSSIYGEIILLFALYPFIQKHKDMRVGTLFGWIISVMSVVVFMIIYTAVFDYPASQDIAYPFQQLSRMARIGTISHLESIYLAIATIASAIHFSIYLYLSAFFLSKVLHLNKFEPLLLPLAGLTVLLGMISPNIFIGNALREYLVRSSSFFLFFFPFILWLLHLRKGRLTNEKA
ncbi:GerAB/ArcD/ProY family transporter [Sporosarcina thermotolerans]|uniref:GerAB/ArcD/ProY family transporter n=1 Tax=Sporosarcina thermotolerans TaxID=633404 RepID=A0AAW9ADN6_9BACL|nr:GerAB/ArcD/ProY family transporter [Sporosarcina thermotolerans]MDW0117733.1 GerAB/ArcD/ProY family transporter [Sporosarcina thermotolerans]WHT49176.1 GerAB/ArcD/ProY family transporter [Sporosarcina thermotolerans]